MKRPALTGRVLRGLRTMASVAQAPTASAYLGTPPEEDGQPNEAWNEVGAAVQWVVSTTIWFANQVEHGRRAVKKT